MGTSCSNRLYSRMLYTSRTVQLVERGVWTSADLCLGLGDISHLRPFLGHSKVYERSFCVLKILELLDLIT